MYVAERNSNFGIEDCFTLNCTLKYCCIPQEKERTLRVKNCLYFNIELFLKLMTKLFQRYTFPSPFSFPYTKLAPSFFPLLLPILFVFKLHVKGCDVCASQLERQIQKTQNYTTDRLLEGSDRARTIFLFVTSFMDVPS